MTKTTSKICASELKYKVSESYNIIIVTKKNCVRVSIQHGDAGTTGLSSLLFYSLLLTIYFSSGQ